MRAEERELEEWVIEKLAKAHLKHAEMMAPKSLTGKTARKTILTGASRGVKTQENGYRALNLQNGKAPETFRSTVNIPTLLSCTLKMGQTSILVIFFTTKIN